MTKILDKSIWKPYLDHVSKTIAAGKQVLIEVASLALGDQIEAEWAPLLGIVYDPKNDLVELALDDLDHLIHGPREIYADTGPVGLESLDIGTTYTTSCCSNYPCHCRLPRTSRL
jgi:hypothetical protein